MGFLPKIKIGSFLGNVAKSVAGSIPVVGGIVSGAIGDIQAKLKGQANPPAPSQQPLTYSQVQQNPALLGANQGLTQTIPTWLLLGGVATLVILLVGRRR